MIHETLVNEKMTTELVTVSPDQLLNEVQEIFDHHIFHHLPVVENNKLTGIISRTDFRNILLGTRLAYGDNVEEINKILSRVTVKDAMSRNPFTVPPTCTMGEISEIFYKEEFHAVPVVAENELVGIITNKDVLNFFMEYDPR